MANKALLVGINKFNDPQISTLRGCVNDAHHWAELLNGGYGFDERNIEVLLDNRVTKRVFVNALDSLLNGCSPGDTAVVIISSHGTQVPDADGDEADGMDEVLVTHDFRWEDGLTDDELSRYLSRVPQGVQLVCFFDTCHSGTMMDSSSTSYRDVGAKPRGLPPDATPRFLPTPRHLIDQHRARVSSAPKAYPGFGPRPSAPPSSGSRQRPGFQGRIPGVSFSAASDNETAADAEFGGTPFGAFSYNLMKTLREGREDMSWEDALREVTQRLRSGGFPQTPRLQVPQPLRGKPVLGGRRGGRGAVVQAGFGPAPVPVVAGGRSLAQANQIDVALGDFKPEDYTVKLCQTMFRIVPFAGEILPYRTIDEAIQALYPQASPAVVQRAYQIAQSEPMTSALRAADLIDKADAGIAAFSGLKGAFNMLFGDRSQALETDAQQGVDAAIKLLGLGYVISKMYPGSIQERVQTFYATPAGKQVVVYYTLIEVALPFLDNAMTASGNFISSLLSKYGSEAMNRLSNAVGGQGASEAQGVIQTMLSWIEGALTSVLPYARTAAEQLKQYMPSAMSVMDKAASVVAAGADALPVYRYLGARLAAESSVLLASREA